MRTKYLITMILAGCNLKPLVSDIPPDAIDAPPAPPPPDATADASNLLPAGTVVPSIATNAELINQIRINDGLNDATLAASGGVVTRGTGKSGGVTVRYWNFGPATIETGIAVLGPMYVFGTVDAGTGAFTPLPDHPPLIDTICGDVRYSAIRRVINVPVTSAYAGQLITTMAALNDAINLGLVSDPVSDGTWVNMPVVLPGTTLEIGDPASYSPMPAQQVFSHGYLVDVFMLGTSLGRQTFKAGQVPIGQDSQLLSGVASGTPPILTTTPDPAPVFQYTIPTTPPVAGAPNYSPLCTDVSVRLASGIAPSAITADSPDLFKRSASGAVTGYNATNVASYTVLTTTNNIQIQYAEGSP